MPFDPAPDRRRQAAFRRLGTSDPYCVLCGERDAATLELHHLAGRAHDEVQAIVCRNCHRKLSDPSANETVSANPPLMERAGHLLIGLAAFLALLVERLRQYGAELLAGALVSPWPYGWVGAPEVA